MQHYIHIRITRMDQNISVLLRILLHVDKRSIPILKLPSQTIDLIGNFERYSEETTEKQKIAKVNSMSLDDYLLPRPDWLASIFGISIRFREEESPAITGDIMEMFNRINR